MEQVAAARSTLRGAIELIDRAGTTVAATIHGTSAADAAQVPVLFRGALASLHEAVSTLQRAEDAIRAYIGVIAGTPTTAGADISPANPVGTTTRIETLRRQLPPPVVASAGQKTHG